MAAAVALVQGYLHVNGHFQVAEFPVLEALRDSQVRTVTDLDRLAYRFAGAGHDLVRGRGHRPRDPPQRRSILLSAVPRTEVT